MAGAFYLWSQTAASNASADATINWREGQAPSSINDSARALMASVASWRDDISGTLTTGGSSTAYTLSTNQFFDTLAHMDGAMVAFVPHATNTGTCTLNVDALGAKPLRSAPSTEIPSGTLVLGTPYVATYDNSASEWLLHGFYANPYNIPLGCGMPCFNTSAPNSAFVFPYGQAISRTTYSALFALWSTTYGSGDGTTTFNVPDLRGRGLFFKDDMGGSAASRIGTVDGITGTTLGSAGGRSTASLSAANLPAHYHDVFLNDPGHSHTISIPTGTGGIFQGGGPYAATIAPTSTNTTGITVRDTSGGGGTANRTSTSGSTMSATAFAIMPPALVANFVIRIL